MSRAACAFSASTFRAALRAQSPASKEFGIRYAVARDADDAVARRYNVTGTPTILFLERGGAVRHFANEFPADYAQQLDALLTE